MTPDPDPNDIPDDENASGAPIADKGAATAPMHGTSRPADGLGSVPGVSPEAVDAIVDGHEARELDFGDGSMDTEELTGGQSVVEAEYADRGPAEHLDDRVDPDAAADIGNLSAGDRLSDAGLSADDDEAEPTDRNEGARQ